MLDEPVPVARRAYVFGRAPDDLVRRAAGRRSLMTAYSRARRRRGKRPLLEFTLRVAGSCAAAPFRIQAMVILLGDTSGRSPDRRLQATRGRNVLALLLAVTLALRQGYSYRGSKGSGAPGSRRTSRARRPARPQPRSCPRWRSYEIADAHALLCADTRRAPGDLGMIRVGNVSYKQARVTPPAGATKTSTSLPAPGVARSRRGLS